MPSTPKFLTGKAALKFEKKLEKKAAKKAAQKATKQVKKVVKKRVKTVEAKQRKLVSRFARRQPISRPLVARGFDSDAFQPFESQKQQHTVRHMVAPRHPDWGNGDRWEFCYNYAEIERDGHTTNQTAVVSAPARNTPTRIIKIPYDDSKNSLYVDAVDFGFDRHLSQLGTNSQMVVAPWLGTVLSATHTLGVMNDCRISNTLMYSSRLRVRKVWVEYRGHCNRALAKGDIAIAAVSDTYPQTDGHTTYQDISSLPGARTCHVADSMVVDLCPDVDTTKPSPVINMWQAVAADRDVYPPTMLIAVSFPAPLDTIEPLGIIRFRVLVDAYRSTWQPEKAATTKLTAIPVNIEDRLALMEAKLEGKEAKIYDTLLTSEISGNDKSHLIEKTEQKKRAEGYVKLRSFTEMAQLAKQCQSSSSTSSSVAPNA